MWILPLAGIEDATCKAWKDSPSPFRHRHADTLLAQQQPDPAFVPQS